MDTQKEYATLMEAYNAVYENQEQLDEARISRSMGRRATQYRRDQEQSAHMERVKKHQNSMENDPEYRERHERLRQTHSRREDQKESFDLFDYLLEYLVAEGYADTNKAALAIMANMSGEWKQDIVEGMDMKAFKERRRKLQRQAASDDAKKRGHVDKFTGKPYGTAEAASRRKDIHKPEKAPEREARRKFAEDPN